MAAPHTGAKNQTRDIGGKHGGQFAKTKGSDFKKFKGAKKLKKILDPSTYKPKKLALSEKNEFVNTVGKGNVGKVKDVTHLVATPPNVTRVLARVDPDELVAGDPEPVHVWGIKHDGETLPIGTYRYSEVGDVEEDLWEEAKLSATHELVEAPGGDLEAKPGEFEPGPGEGLPAAPKQLKVPAGKEPFAPVPDALKDDAPEPVTVNTSGNPIKSKAGDGKKVPLTLSQRKHIVTLRDAGPALGVQPQTAQAQKPYDYFVAQGLATKVNGVYYPTPLGEERANDISPKLTTGLPKSDLGDELDAMVKNPPSGEGGKPIPKDAAPTGPESLTDEEKDTIMAKVNGWPLPGEGEGAPIGVAPLKGTNAPTAGGFPALWDLKAVGKVTGTTGPKLVADASGNKYVMKTGKGGAGLTSPAHLESELLADNLYQSMGADVPDVKKYTGEDGNPIKVSRFIEGGKSWNDVANSGTPEEIADFKKKLQDKFAVDAWMATWDVVGVGSENPAANVLMAPDGKAYRIDNGGALTFKGMGGPKGDNFKDDVGELVSMRTSNNVNKDVFGDLTDAQVAEQIKRDFTPEKFDEVFAVDGPFSGDDALKAKMEKRWHSTVAWGKAHEAKPDELVGEGDALTPGDLDEPSQGSGAGLAGDLKQGETIQKADVDSPKVTQGQIGQIVEQNDDSYVIETGQGNITVEKGDAGWVASKDVKSPDTGPQGSFTGPNTPVNAAPGSSVNAVGAGPWSGKKQTNNIGSPELPGALATVKELDLAPGDVVQLKKGGWSYEVTDVSPTGTLTVKGTNAMNAHVKDYVHNAAVPLKVTKADGSKLKLKGPDSVSPAQAAAAGKPTIPAGTPPMNKAQLQAAMVDGSTIGKTIGELPVGTVFGTPDGKVAVLESTPDPAQKFTKATSVMTGDTFNVQTKHVPTKVEPTPGTLTSAAEALTLSEKAKPKPKNVTKTSALDEWKGIENSATAKASIAAIQAGTKAKLSPNQINVLKGYTNGTYGTINNSLRKEEMSLDTLEKVQAMDSVFDAIDGIPNDMITHRGTHAQALTGKIEPGQVIYDKGYMSTSPTKPWQRPVILHIKLKKGSKALWGPTTGGDVTAGEDEIILRRSTMMQVKEVQEVSGVQHIYVETYA